MPDEKSHADRDLAKNRRAFHEYDILDTFEVGIVLCGTEVKSCRAHNVNLADGYARVIEGEVQLCNVHISPYEQGNLNNHKPVRPRKLLLHKKEIRRLKTATEQKGLTLIPLRFYLNRGKVKVALGLCKGRGRGDKREALKRKDTERQLRQVLQRRRE